MLINILLLLLYIEVTLVYFFVGSIVFVLGTTEFRAYTFPFPYYYQSGDDIILDCRVPSNYMFQFWTLPSSENISTSSGHHHIMTMASTVTLSITNTSSSDDGTYVCNACKILSL